MAVSDFPATVEPQSVDYLICRNCSSPCYIFEMNGSSISEATCTVCGNEESVDFDPGDSEA